MKRIVIIDGHPDPDEHRFVHALARAYEFGAREAGHEAVYIQIATLEFPLLRSNADFYGGIVSHEVRRAQLALIRCDHIVMLYPLWLGNMPALLKGFLEQVFRRSVAFSELHKTSASHNILRGKSARIVTTMAMPPRFYRPHFAAHGLTALKRNIGGFLGISPISSQIIGSVETLSDAQRATLLEEMRALGRKAG